MKADLTALRVAVGEDDALLRRGIIGILQEAGLDVVVEAGDADDLVRSALRRRPDIVVSDVRMPPHREGDGLAAAIELRRRLPDVRVLILSQICEPVLALELIDTRPEGVGYLLKERVADVNAFIGAVARVASGGSALDPELVAQLLDRDPGDPILSLNEREHAALAALAEGKSNKGIAEAMSVSEATAEEHATAVLRKLDIDAAQTEQSRVHAVLRYLSREHALW